MRQDQKIKERFEPLHEAHAIEQVLFVVQISPALDDRALAEARKIAGQFRSELPGSTEIQGFAMAIGGPGPMTPIPTGPMVGSVFHRTRPDGTIENELRIERASVTFRTTSYTRWDAVWTQASKYLSALVPHYLSRASLSALSLNFVDKFVWAGEVGRAGAGLLLRSGSNYLCPHIFAAEDLWHSHTGVFLRPNDATKRLLNINVDCLDQSQPDGQRRVVGITTVLTDFLNQPGYTATVVSPDDRSFIDHRMKQLHNFSKETFGNIINDDMSKRIALID